MRRSNSTRSASQLTVLITIIVAMTTLYFTRVVLVPLALAILFAFLLAPVVRLLDRARIPRIISSVGIVVVTVAGLALLGWVVTGELVDVANQLPAYRSNIRAKIALIYTPKTRDFKKAATAIDEISKEIVAPAPASTNPNSPRGKEVTPPKDNSSSHPVPVQVEPGSGSPLESLNTLVGPVSVVGLVIVFTLFMLIRREDLRNRFIRLVGHQHLNLMTQAFDDASSKVSRYLFLQLSVNVGFGLIVGLGLYLIGVPHVLLWGLTAGLLRFLPYVGALLSGLLPILLSIAMFDGWTRPLLTIALYVAAELLISNIVEPLLYGSQVGLSSLAILVAAVFWTVLWGPVGLILSTPLTVCLAVLGRYVPNLRFLSIILGDDPVLPPESHFYQRLLASDEHEARLVLEEYLKEHRLGQLYDSVIIPALALAEQDRHRNDLDDETQKFILWSTKELVDEFGERSREIAINTTKQDEGGNYVKPPPAVYSISAVQADTIVCVPARDEADEIVGTMLMQLLERSGRRSRSVPVGPIEDLLALIEGISSPVVCISALPPLAVSHARHLYMELRKRFPTLKILIGLWGVSGDTEKIAERLRLSDGDRIVGQVEQVLVELDDDRAVVAEHAVD
jgi:predicted PurR-regulated permease PerM